jgi:hypothetical protein
MTGTESRAVIAVEVLEKQNAILPLGIGLELFCTPEDRTGDLPAQYPTRQAFLPAVIF